MGNDHFLDLVFCFHSAILLMAADFMLLFLKGIKKKKELSGSLRIHAYTMTILSSGLDTMANRMALM